VSRPEAIAVLRRGGADVGTWPVGAGAGSRLAVIEELARLHLGARRLGCSLVVRSASCELLGLLRLVGLLDVLSVEVEGQAEGLEQRRVEEVVHADDPVA
jgi:hypothetical protein